MQTSHRLFIENAKSMNNIQSKSIQLIVTSPPYPMIQMWDGQFVLQDASIEKCIQCGAGKSAFDRMHLILDEIWEECDRILADGGFICINIGDAVRTLDGRFQLYPNHTHIVNRFFDMGYSVLPDIHWRKPSNAPNKFMGSGMYPAGAYVTYEHEYILVFRKGENRKFSSKEKITRRESAYFWEERNTWFSDLWEIKGVPQKMSKQHAGRIRSAAFPLEIPYRLVNMYSIKGDTVLDPFCGLGTTTLACMASQRNSISVDIDEEIIRRAAANIEYYSEKLNDVVERRIGRHLSFIGGLLPDQVEKCYWNAQHDCLVKTRQEKDIKICQIQDITRKDNEFICTYE